MKRDDKISIIIAAYNTEKYIKKCLESVLNQTHKNLEVLVVNDHSKDKTLDIIQEIAEKDKRIIVINNEENKGLSYNRNIAYEKSTGNYIGYIDSDDYIEEDYYEKMYQRMQQEKSDVCVCDMKLIYEKDETATTVECGGRERIDFINNGLAASCCNKLFRREVLQEHAFSVGKVNEDLAVVLPILIKAKKVSYEKSVSYNYIQRDNSIQNSKISDKRFDIFYGVELTLDRIKNCKDYEDYASSIVFQQLITLFLYVFCNEKNFFRRCKWFHKYAKMIKPYHIIQNKYYQEFLENSGTKHKIYYSILLKLIDWRLSIVPSFLVDLYRLGKKIIVRNVIKKNIDLDLLKKKAKRQSKLQNNISVSVIIPNYNYEKFLFQRLYSILNQTEKVSEIIILDDCSKDNSRDLIKKICKELKEYINISYIFNETNSGSAFKQWEKGFKHAKGDYVWICEADDYCDEHFLETVLKPIETEENVRISYTDTAFIDKEGTIIYRSIKPEIDLLKTGHWDNNFVRDGIDEIKDYIYLNCTIANVSGALIKNDNYDEFFKESGKLKQAGDWLFYINVMSKGKIAYHKKALNYYRLHGNNVTSITKKQSHFNEIKTVHKKVEEQFGLNNTQKKNIKDRYKFLEKVWSIEID